MPRALIIGNTDGIGLALTESLLADGWQVAGMSRSTSRIGAESGAYVHHVIDVCDASYPAQLAAAVARFEALDVCIYCAGIGEFVQLATFESDRRVFEVNLIGAVATAQVVLPRMLAAGRGHFIGLSSQADIIVDPHAPSYAASKAGMSSYLEALALACRPRGVHITNLRFGFVDTKMAKSPLRPFMVTPARAAEEVRRCMRSRPIRHTFPVRLMPLVWLLRVGRGVQRWFL